MKKIWLILLSLLTLLCFGACAGEDPGPTTYNVTVEKNIATAGEVSGDGVYEGYKIATLTATTNTGYTFLGWYESGLLKDADESYSFAVTGNKLVEARWEAISYAVSVNKNIDEAGTVTGAGTYTYGQTATLTATTEEGYEFLGWYNSIGLVNEATTYSFVVTGDVALTAKWQTPLVEYTCAVEKTPAEGGSIWGAGTYVEGQTAQLEATENEGYEFLGWYDGAALVHAEKTYSFEMTEDVSLTAKWQLKTYAISVSSAVQGVGSVQQAGTVSITGTGIYTHGDSITITATTNTGYNFNGWYDGNTLVSVDEAFTFKASGNKTYVAKWYKDQSKGEPGWGGIF